MLLLLLLLLLLLWLLVFNMCNLQGRGHMEEVVQGVKSAAGRPHRSNFVLETEAKACPGNIVENFFVLLWIPASLSPISFQTIRVGSDRFWLKLCVSLHHRDHRHASSVLVSINLSHLM